LYKQTLFLIVLPCEKKKERNQPTDSEKEELFKFKATSLISIQMQLGASWQSVYWLKHNIQCYLDILWQDVVLKSILTIIHITMILINCHLQLFMKN